MSDEQVQHRPGCDVYAGYKQCTCGIEWKVPKQGETICIHTCYPPPVDPTPRLHTCGAAITLSTLMAAMTRSGLKWRMHPAQKLAIEYNAVYSFISFMEETKRDVTAGTEELTNAPYAAVHTLMGLPMEVDNTMNKQVIELWAGDELLHVIDGLAIPSAMMVYPDDYVQG